VSRGVRSSFLLSVTLTDFVLTLFFLLLLLAAHRLFEAERASREKDSTIRTLIAARTTDRWRIERLQEDVRSLETRAEIVRRFLEKFPDLEDREVERLVLVALRDARRLAELEAQNRSLDTKRVTLEEQIAQLERQVAALSGGAGASCAADLVAAKSARDDALRQGRFCFDRLAKSGFGKKPCWVDAGGRIEYVFAVTITEEAITVAPSWPPARAADAQQLPGVAALSGTWPATEFAARAAPILAWSEAQDCRHYVTIEDQATSKAAFKRNLLTVEGYFYKLLLGETKARSAAALALPAPAGAASEM